MRGIARRLLDPTQQSERGAALVELALSLPLFAVILVGTVDFGRVFYTSMAVTQSARAGAEWGAQSTSNAGDNVGITNAAQKAVGEGAQADLTVTVNTPTKTCQCVPDAPGAPSDLDTATVACSTVCTGGQHLIMSISVNTAKTFSTISLYPGIPRTLSISRTMKMRVQ